MAGAKLPGWVTMLLGHGRIRCPMLACRCCHRPLLGIDICDQCNDGDIPQRSAAEDLAAEIGYRVRHHVDAISRARAIEAFSSYTARHLRHVERRGAFAHGPSTLADTQELEVLS